MRLVTLIVQESYDRQIMNAITLIYVIVKESNEE